MFNCYYCEFPPKPREKPTKIVTRTRQKTYPDGSKGWEIVEEQLACQACVKALVKMGIFGTIDEENIGEVDNGKVRFATQ